MTARDEAVAALAEARGGGGQQLDAILANPEYRAALLAVLDDGRLARAEAVVEAAQSYVNEDPTTATPARYIALRDALAAHDTEAGSE